MGVKIEIELDQNTYNIAQHFASQNNQSVSDCVAQAATMFFDQHQPPTEQEQSEDFTEPS